MQLPTRERWPWLILPLLALAAAGCGTTRWSDTQRTATEQLLLSDAIDDAVAKMDVRAFAGRKIFFDTEYIDDNPHKKYLISCVRHHLLNSGCALQEKREEAEFIVEANAGAVGTDRNDLLVGVPQMTVPAVVPGMPTTVPEIPVAKKTRQEGVAKIGLYAYERASGQIVWQSGTTLAETEARDLWVMGAGPFERDSSRTHTEFAGSRLPIPSLSLRDRPSEPMPAAPGRAQLAADSAAQSADSPAVAPAAATAPGGP